jgi:hypothetical protein
MLSTGWAALLFLDPLENAMEMVRVLLSSSMGDDYIILRRCRIDLPCRIIESGLFSILSIPDPILIDPQIFVTYTTYSRQLSCTHPYSLDNKFWQNQK